MRARRTLVALALAALSLPWSAAQERKGADPARVARLVVEATNEFRRGEGLRALEVDRELSRAARDFAAFMARTGKFGHEADGRTPAQRAREHGYDYCLLAENIAFQFRSDGFASEELAGRFLDRWKRSPGHRMNLVDPDATHTAVVVARSEEGGFYAVQMFGRPSSESFHFEVRNESLDRLRYRVGGQDFSLAPRTARTHRRCATEKIVFDLDRRDEPRHEAFEARDGDRFVVERRGGGGFSVRRR